jgi:hypothetical protein
MFIIFKFYLIERERERDRKRDREKEKERKPQWDP